MATTKKSTHPLQHLVPEPEAATSYISRFVGGTVVTDSDGNVVSRRGGRADLNVLAYCLDRSASERRLFAPRIVGPTGAGKTHVVRAFAASKGLPYSSSNLAPWGRGSSGRTATC